MALPVLHASPLVDYPDTDGLPMAESDFQLYPLLHAVMVLRLYFQERADVYVAGNLFIYYEEGNREAVIAPDVFVVIGTPKRDRSSYFLWREPKGPDFVLEITSQSTRSRDQAEKPSIYARLGVREYFQYDPTGDYLVPHLQGFRLIAGVYQPMAATGVPAGVLILHSEVLGLDLRLEDGALRFYDPATDQGFPTYAEAVQAQRQAEERARQEAVLRQAAEARMAELEARLQVFQATRPPGAPREGV